MVRTEARIRRALSTVVSMVAVVGLATATASAQVGPEASMYFGHLTCFKAKSDQTFKGSADLSALLVGIEELRFADECDIKKLSHVCIHTNKANATGSIKKEPVSVQAGAPRATQVPQICYKIKCKKTPRDLQLQDQFADHTLSRLKADILCGPAVTTCRDASRTVYGGGPFVGEQGGSCRQFSTQATCEQAWVAMQAYSDGALVPMQCAWENGLSLCGGAESLGMANTCVNCADASLSEVDYCWELSFTDAATCEARWQIAGFGPTSCVYVGDPGTGECMPCGLTEELQLPNAFSGPCTNQCRPRLMP